MSDRLAEHFGQDRIFRDIDTIEPGSDFVDAIREAIDASTVMLAVIDEEWTTVTDQQGRPRLANPQDYVRIEIETALALRMPVVPILVHGASMPTKAQLPPSMGRLATKQALIMEDARTEFEADMSKLITTLERAGVRPAGGAGRARRVVLRGGLIAAGVVVAIGVILVAGIGAGWFRSSSSQPPLAVRTPDCSQAAHPAYGTELRTTILDGLRRHAGYEGKYIVQRITKIGDWVYVEAAPTTTGVDRGYLVQFDGLNWNWRWEGSIGARPGGSGYPPDFTGAAQDVLVCPQSS